MKNLPVKKSFVKSPTKIYTRVGDKGNSSIVDGVRVPKSDLVFHCLGTIDELNSNVGLAVEFVKVKMEKEEKFDEVKKELVSIQKELVKVGSIIANANITYEKHRKLFVGEERVKELEKRIDEITAKLPNLSNFLLPGGSFPNAQIHVCRTICRRAERNLVMFNKVSERKDSLDDVLMYFNRLSDFLFTLARYSSKIEKKKDIVV